MHTKCLLVDNEPPALKCVESYIQNVPNLELVAKCNNAFDAMQVLSRRKVDLMILDIHLPMLLGTEFVRTLRNPPKVIFTCADKEFATEAFELEAIDYLLKPVSMERFLKAVAKAKAGADRNPSIGFSASPVETSFLYLRVERKMVRVILDDILFIESLKDYVKIVRLGHKPLLVKQSISALEDMLPENRFARIHRSYIVAINKLTAFTNRDVEINENIIPIGKLYFKQVSRFSGWN